MATKEKIVGYKIVGSDKSQHVNLWKAQSESLIALLAVQLGKDRTLSPHQVCTDLNFKYLRKRISVLKSNYGPTRLQRAILENEGY